MQQTASELLGEDGPLAKTIPGYITRTQQQDMADAVMTALEDDAVLIAEAGTGTGKTFAYLVPAMMSGKKVIVSTGTKNLQDQLFYKDVPVVRDALNVPVRIAMLKGRANYLCPHRLELAEQEGRFQSRQQVSELQEIRKWGGRTRSGDIAELDTLSEDSMLWPRVTSTADNCLGQECGQINNCFLMQARKKAQEADVLVVNHHLLMADMALKDEGFGELLPGANAFILDEAHQLPEIASSFFGESLSSYQLIELAQDTIAEDMKAGSAVQTLSRSADELQKAVQDFRLGFGVEVRREGWKEVSELSEIKQGIAVINTLLAKLENALVSVSDSSKGLENCYRRCQALALKFDSMTGESPNDHIHWFETYKRSVTINLTPLNVANTFKQQMQAQKSAWIFTSATLAVGGNFEHFSRRLGIEDARTGCWDSPFDFKSQAMLYVPQDMPEPNTEAYTRTIVERAIPVIEACRGGVFMLFTSHRALQQAAELLEGRIDYPILIQGDSPRSRLLEQFRQKGNAVLLGTGSFWEGVDVRGEALSCVIIDKLPFASPGDPVMQARIENLRSNGGNPFMSFQIPDAVITLKQGVGRLIRDVNDYGVLMLCDPRLINKPYGKIFLDSLPRMYKSQELEMVQRFYRYHHKPATESENQQTAETVV
ncbi:MAG: ATP-dependent DNA helicase [Gammaproteobacteria bacterium]|nr:ATP-dependent DNA helicase [Gammaproteobacteria bacterium]